MTTKNDVHIDILEGLTILFGGNKAIKEFITLYRRGKFELIRVSSGRISAQVNRTASFAEARFITRVNRVLNASHIESTTWESALNQIPTLDLD